MVMDETQQTRENLVGKRANKSRGLELPARPLPGRESGTHRLRKRYW